MQLPLLRRCVCVKSRETLGFHDNVSYVLTSAGRLFVQRLYANN